LLVAVAAVSIGAVSAKTVAAGRVFNAALVQAVIVALGSCDPQVLPLLPNRDGAVQGNPDAGRSSASSCSRDRECQSPLARCDVEAGRCVECLSGADCDPSQQCDPATRRCTVPCGDDRDCRAAGGELDYCDTHRGFCVECFSNDDCAGSRRTLLCEQTTGRCVECLSTADCGGSACDPDFYYCASGR
jgi:hypothetical protein